MIQKIKLVSVVGPTASGKTKLAVELAKNFDGEIVSAQLSTAELPGLTVVTLRARCCENIARPSNTTP